MIPRAILADDTAGWVARKRARTAYTNRVARGWSEDKALDTPIGDRGRPVAQPSRAPVTVPYSDDTVAMTLVSRLPDGMPLEAIGAHLGIVRERVRQIEACALAKLRAALEREGLEARDIGAWLASRPESDPDRNAPRAEPWVTSAEARDRPLPVEPWSDHGQRVEAACRELDETQARARARRDVARVVEGMEM